ncbi:AAA family ATPase [Cyanobium sp. ATX 6A2]|uniref:AAA family ATPase n=1 Tax=Cyanobium sp. ATX 6A2 TaxID=2823700 RepID=UPI0020CCE35E|nr:AAA family ATPase [Cyanobium sp. ATX 6A2]MCP9888431.1 AAA family ATPase [Cyanobium sp. ATX 6A2]
MTDLFSHQREVRLRRLAPLADRLRPRTLDEFVGQEGILGPGRLLRRAIAADRVGNLILHGPPGVGKTTLARIIAGTTRAHFSSLNAVLAGVKDLRAEVEAARQRLELHGLRTTLFIDEVHRFNTAQQDALLPWVENGTVNLIGATTENPFFEVNKALVSRSRLFRMQPLEPRHLSQLLERALADPERGYGDRAVTLSAEAAAHLVDVAGGDARSLLNALELAVETSEPDGNGAITIDLAIAEESIQQRAVLYDKQGDAHFDTISAFIKSLRGSDPDAALFWLARMVEAGENPRFIFRRMLIAAGEDVGLADPQAIVVVEACAAAFERVGLPEGLYPLAQAALYLAGAEKSNSILGFFDAVKTVRSANRQQVPSHLRDANRDGRAFGDGVGYRYPHAYGEHWVAQQYLPGELQGEVFWQPGQLGWEGALRQRLQQRRAAQLAAAAETALEGGEVLSSGPDDPQLERWLQRQAASEGARLDVLRQRFWAGASWQRHHRVLLLDGHSLLWALDPLQATPEGGVTIQVRDEAVAERLRAQLQVLDTLRRPDLAVSADGDPARLAAACGKGPFEWIAARRVGEELTTAVIERLARAFTPLLADHGQWRLLFSQPLLGPMTALNQSGALGLEPEEPLQLALAAEARVQKRQQQGLNRWRAALKGEGLTLESATWNETLHLHLNDALLERWLAPTGPYRRQLRGLSDDAFKALGERLRRSRGVQLPQDLRHTLLSARR